MDYILFAASSHSFSKEVVRNLPNDKVYTIYVDSIANINLPVCIDKVPALYEISTNKLYLENALANKVIELQPKESKYWVDRRGVSGFNADEEQYASLEETHGTTQLLTNHRTSVDPQNAHLQQRMNDTSAIAKFYKQ